MAWVGYTVVVTVPANQVGGVVAIGDAALPGGSQILALIPSAGRVMYVSTGFPTGGLLAITTYDLTIYACRPPTDGAGASPSGDRATTMILRETAITQSGAITQGMWSPDGGPPTLERFSIPDVVLTNDGAGYPYGFWPETGAGNIPEFGNGTGDAAAVSNYLSIIVEPDAVNAEDRVLRVTFAIDPQSTSTPVSPAVSVASGNDRIR